MTQRISKPKTILLSQTRTDKDKTMIIIGILLIALFILIIYFSVDSKTFHSDGKPNWPTGNLHGSLEKSNPEICYCGDEIHSGVDNKILL